MWESLKRLLLELLLSQWIQMVTELDLCNGSYIMKLLVYLSLEIDILKTLVIRCSKIILTLWRLTFLFMGLKFVMDGWYWSTIDNLHHVWYFYDEG